MVMCWGGGNTIFVGVNVRLCFTPSLACSASEGNDFELN